MTSSEMAKLAVEALEDRKAEEVTVIDIREVSPIADFFIIASGNNMNQLQAMRDAADEALYKALKKDCSGVQPRSSAASESDFPKSSTRGSTERIT